MKHTQYILTMILTLLLSITGTVGVTLNAASITVQGPSQVAIGEQFNLRYVVNTTDIKNFTLRDIPDAFEVLIGPITSTQQSFSMVGGKTTHTASVTYTYVLMANQSGTYVIPAARANIDGKPATSQAIRINVSGKASTNTQQGGGQQRRSNRVDRAGAQIRGNDLFIRVTANKKHVYEQEPVLLTYKVYTQVELTQLEGKMPDLNGFHTQEVPLPQQKSFHIEQVGGRAYNCVTWSQYVMFPQMSGKLEIPSITFKGIVMQQNNNIDPFEAFFNGGSGFIEVKKEIKAPSVSIQVSPLPARPADFSGGVGQFSITASLDKQTVNAGDPVNLRIQVSGTGNMKLLRQPQLDLPKDFDKYDAKITDKTRLSVNGVTGSMIYDILIVPRNMGRYVIPALKFVYFDTKSNTYQTLTTKEIPLTVEKGTGTSTAITDYSQKADNDIHDIKKSVIQAENVSDTLFGSNLYLSLNAIVLISFMSLVIIFRKRALALSDVTAVRGRKANRVAVRRLKKAARLMAQGKDGEFYDEVLQALWGYVSDKLTMPVEQLSRDNVADKFHQRGVAESVTVQFIEAIDECEYARFAPGDTTGNMQKTYEKATHTITTIEDNIR